jgi:hypothetical protein
VISALTQLKIIDALYQQKNPSRRHGIFQVDGADFNEDIFEQDIVTACSSIFIHNIDPFFPGFSDQIDFQRSPLPFILVFCDIFQEWDRYAEHRPVYSGHLFSIECVTASISAKVPSKIEKQMAEQLSKKLKGLTVVVNDSKVI